MKKTSIHNVSSVVFCGILLEKNIGCGKKDEKISIFYNKRVPVCVSCEILYKLSESLKVKMTETIGLFFLHLFFASNL